jgi:hypothetical protein
MVIALITSPEIRLAQAALNARMVRLQHTADPQLRLAVRAVKQVQAQRLAKTHADLLVSARFGSAAKFFLDDLYGDKDFSQRDEELSKVIPALQKFLPKPALEVIADAVELDGLSETLDLRIAQSLINLGFDGQMNAQQYRQAYCLAESATRPTEQSGATRERQMQLADGIGRTLDQLVRKPFLGGLLASMTPVAAAAGVSTMHDFLSRGFLAFKHMGGAVPFLEAIRTRESQLHDALLSDREMRTDPYLQNLIGLSYPVSSK